MTTTKGKLPLHIPGKPAEQQGVFRKFEVRRADGSSRIGGKHYGCEYFVLDVAHDPHAKAALAAYAESCASTHPELSKDMVARYDLEAEPTTTTEADAYAMTTSERIAELVSQHGGLRAAARAIQIDASYLHRLATGEKDDPSALILRRLGLKKIITYAPISAQAWRVAPAAVDKVARSQREKVYESLLRSAVAQLRQWNVKYGNHQPSWLPPGGEVQLVETIEDWIGPSANGATQAPDRQGGGT